MPSQAATQIHSTTQQFLEIYDVTNDLAIMKDGATSIIITVAAMNFGLLAEEEQDAIMYAYAGLLNSLTYPIQIVIKSQTKDATNYLNLLKEQELKASTPTKRSFIEQYRGFVSDLIRERNVLDKKFYVVVTATSLEMGFLPPQTVVPGVKQVDISSIERSTILEKARTILEPRRDHLISQFGRIGLYARQLQTQEIIQLFYTSYNPEAAEGQGITDTSDYVQPVVAAQMPLAPLPTPPAPTQTFAPAPVVQTEPSMALNSDIYQQPPAVTSIPVDEATAQVLHEQTPPAPAPTATPVVEQPVVVQETQPYVPPVNTNASEVTPPPTAQPVVEAQVIPSDPGTSTPVAETPMPPAATIYSASAAAQPQTSPVPSMAMPVPQPPGQA